METEKLDKLFQQARELPPEVSFKTIEKLVMLQPVVPIAAKIAGSWWKSKFFLNVSTAAVITSSSAALIYYNVSRPAKQAAKEPVHRNEIVTEQPQNSLVPLETQESRAFEPQSPEALLPPCEPGDYSEPETEMAESIGDDNTVSAGETADENADEGSTNYYAYAYSTGDEDSQPAEAAVYSHKENGNSASSCARCSSSDSLWDCIERSLVEDNLVNVKRGYRFEMTPAMLLINGKVTDESVRLKYEKLYERLSGGDLSAHYHIEVNIDRRGNTAVSTSVGSD